MAGDLLDLGVEHGVVEKSGAWYSYGEVRIGQGRENAKTFLTEHSDVAAKIREAILSKVGHNRRTGQKTDAPPTDADRGKESKGTGSSKKLQAVSGAGGGARAARRK